MRYTMSRFTRSILSLDDFMALPRQGVEHTSSITFWTQGSTCIRQQCGTITTDI